MFRLLNLCAAVCTAAALVLGGGTFATAQRQAVPRVPASVRVQALAGTPVRVIVGVRAGFTPEGQLDAGAVAAQRADISGRLRAVIARLPPAAGTRARTFTTIPFFAAEIDAVTLLQLEQDPDVVSIEEDVAVPPTLFESAPLVGAPAAWSGGYTGSGWTVAILDTGVDKTHSFLTGKVVSEACYSNAGGYGDGISFCPGGATSSTAPGSGVNCSPAYPSCFHGTHVAGIAAGTGTSFHGVARSAGVISIQVFTGFPASSSVSSYWSDLILGLERVLALRAAYNIAAVNMSLGSWDGYDNQSSCDADNSSIKAAIDNLRSVGIASVISSGNRGFSDSVSAPGCISSAISVGSTDKSDVLSSFSNTAYFLSLLAPGSLIWSSVPGGSYGFASGTSMAAPHVTGAWALAKQRKPWASVTEILAALRDTGVPVTDPLSSRTFPRIRVDRAIDALITTEMSLDAPANGTTVGSSFGIGGWAIDGAAAAGTGVNEVLVYAFPTGGGSLFLGEASYGVIRIDVGDVFGARFTNSGFNLNVNDLPAGTYQIVAYARSTVSGTLDVSRSAAVTVTGPVSNPLASIDAPASGATVAPSFLVGGWAIDTGAPDGAGVDAVHIYAYPTSGAPFFLGAASYGDARPDVGAALGARFTNSGFNLTTAGLAPGPYTISVYFRSILTGTFAVRARSITVREPGDPLMALDTPSDGGNVSQPFLFGGWAIDRDATIGTGVDAVHVWAYPAAGGSTIFVGAASYGVSRPDVGALFGSNFANSGYDLAVSSLPPGLYYLVAYAHSTVTGTFNQWRVVAVTIRD